MEKLNFFRILIAFCLIIQAISLPLPQSDDFCSGDDFLKFENGQDYAYSYETKTTLFINDISDEAKSSLSLKTNVVVTQLSACTYLLNLDGSSLSGESLNDADSADVVSHLNDYSAVFRLNSQGELDSNVKFDSNDKQWSRNIKRAIISAFQVKSQKHLRSLEGENSKSAVVYETDILGRCRTTYSFDESTQSFDKTKSLHRCTLNNNYRSSAVQFVPYKTLPEFLEGRLFIENHNCKTSLNNGLINSVECKEVSTYKIGSRGPYGVQAIVQQSLNFVKASSSSSSAPNTDSFESKSIEFEYDNEKNNELEASNFSIDEFTSEICEKSLEFGLSNEHSSNFRDLILTIRPLSAAELTSLYEKNKAKCYFAGLTVSQAIVFANTDASIEAVLSMLDKNEFDDQKYITEYPILTALARNENPSANLINKLKDYLNGKSQDYVYLNKMYLVYSSLVSTHCKHQGCSDDRLNELSSIFSKNLGNDCSDENNKNVVVASLKAIGNIGNFASTNVLESCAANKQNSLEIRVNAIQALRRFSCSNFNNLDGNYNLLQDTSDDAEIRINAFLALVRCSDESAKFADFAANKLTNFLVEESDSQVLSFIIDYGKEHGLTTILNAALNDPRIREKFSVNFKELSWNNYKYMYSVMRDAAIEVDTSVIYTGKTFIPRSIRFNVTLHMFGSSVNFMDANLRLEGLDEILKAIIIDKLRSEELIKRVMEKPEQLIELLQIVADKLKYNAERPQLALSLRVYGSDVFYSKLDEKEEFQKLANFVKSGRERLYRQVMTIRSVFLVDSHFTQPLLNGFAFNTKFDVSGAILVNKASTKNVADDEYNFDLDNFYSASVSMIRKYEINVNNKNRLALKKKAFFNGRLKLSIEGTKKEGHWKYNMNLSPMTKIPLVTLDGQFYKLGANSQYVKVTQFKTEEKQYVKCNSEQFKTNVGIDFCLSVQRPKFGKLRDILKQRRQGDLEEDFNDYYEDMKEDGGDDDEETVKRPQLILAGPYHYEITLNNPDLLKSVGLNINFDRQAEKSDVSMVLSTTSNQDEKVNRLELTYSRERRFSLRELYGKVEVSLKASSTNDVRFKLLGDFNYRKNEILESHFEIDNKIVREFNHKFNFGRVNNDNNNNVIPKYFMEALIHRKSSEEPKRYNIEFDLTPTGRDISGNFIIEKQNAETQFENVKIASGKLTLTSNQDKKIDYSINVHGESKRGATFCITGKALVDLFNSNIDLSIDYQGPNVALPQPAKIKLSHLYDGSENAKSFIQVSLDLPLTPIKHGFKSTFSYNVATNKLSYLDFEIERPSSSTPLAIFYEKTVKTSDDAVDTKEYLFGIRSCELDLSKSEASFAATLIKVDDQPIMRSLVFNMIKQHKKGAKISYEFYAKKNNNPFVTLKANAYGNLKAVSPNSGEAVTELPKQSFGADLYIKLLENSGAISTQLNAESSQAKKKHEFEFTFKTENLFRILTRLASITSKFSVDNDKALKCEVEVKKLGEVKSFKITSTSASVRASSDSKFDKEFDVSFEKKLANGKTLKGSGVAKYTFKSLNNYETLINVPDHYTSRVFVETKPSDESTGQLAYYNVEFSNSHLDFDPTERKVKLFYRKKVDAKQQKVEIIVNARRGELNQLEKKEKLTILVDLNAKQTFSVKTKAVVSSVNSLALKSKRFNLDLDSSLKFENSNSDYSNIKVNTKSAIKLPAIITDPGKMNSLSHKLDFSKNEKKEVEVNNQFVTDSKLFGRIFRVLNVDFKRKLNDENDSVHADLDLSYKLAKDADDVDKPLTNFKLAIDHNYGLKGQGSFVKLNVKQNRKTEFETKYLKPGQVIEISDCTYKHNFNKEKIASVKYQLDAAVSVECNGKLLTQNLLAINRVYNEDEEPSTRAELSTKSDILYSESFVKVAHNKFTNTNGLIGVSLKIGEVKSYASEFSYTRTLNKDTSKLENAKYRVSSSFGPALSKACNLNIEVREDYYNSLSCRLNTTRVPNIELNYGYNFKLENLKQMALDGKRGYHLDLIVPGRTMRLVYKAQSVSKFVNKVDAFVDDDENNDEGDYSAEATFHWNLIKEPTKFITLNIKRDNDGKGKIETVVEALNTPNFNKLQLRLSKLRTFNQTNMQAVVSYELAKNSVSNSASVNALFSSDLDTNSFSLETNIEKPAFNVLYENRFNKNNARLQYLSIRLGKVIRLTVDKEYDPEQRRISLQLNNPNSNKYSLDAKTVSKSSNNNNIHIVECTLSENSKQLSQLISKFDSSNNQFDVLVNGIVTGNSYRFNFGLYNESIANAFVSNVNNNKVLGKASLQVLEDAKNGEHKLVLAMQWNRLWKAIQQDIIGVDKLETLADQNNKFNSYMGDVYGELTSDLKQIIEDNRKARSAIRDDFANLLDILIDYYSNYLPKSLKSRVEEMRQKKMQAVIEERFKEQQNTEPLYKRAFKRYNEIAQKLTDLSLKMRKYSKRLSKYIPRLPTYQYNTPEAGAVSGGEYENNLLVSRPTLYAKNLYQFNAEYRNYVKNVGQLFLRMKRNLVRSNLGGIGIKALINKYKYRSLSDYTLVGHVFNKRNIIAFDGEAIVVQSQCKYLLAHETAKNRFSVVLNFDKSKYPISVFAYGSSKSVDLGYEGASFEDKPISLPFELSLPNGKGVIEVNKVNDAVCLELNNDLKVCCYDDSKSCTVATTRWFTGKLNGLMGKADNNIENINQADWFLKSSCSFQNQSLKKPNQEAVSVCHSMFGRHRRAVFRNAIQAIKPDGWLKICESVLTVKIEYKCAIMKAFVNHARQESIEVDALPECYTCNMKSKEYKVNQKVGKNDAELSTNFEKGADYVFLVLPCDKNKYKIDHSKIGENFKSSNNRYYIVKVDEDDASIYQSESGETYNFDMAKSQAVLAEEKTSEISKNSFKKGLFLAASLFSKRMAEHRFLVIKSCGNCLRRSLIASRYVKKIMERNVIVHSFGDYSMKNIEDDESEDIPFAYDNKNVMLINKNSKQVDTDILDNYKIDHKTDMCQQLAVKTNGMVVDINQMSQPEVGANIAEQFSNAENKKYTYKVSSCEKLDTPYGDLTDFTYVKTAQVDSEEDEEN